MSGAKFFFSRAFPFLALQVQLIILVSIQYYNSSQMTFVAIIYCKS